MGGLLIFALILAPFGLDGGVSASESHTHFPMGAGADPDDDGFGDAGHGPMHCGSYSCSPSYIAGSAVEIIARDMSYLARMIAADDPLLSSLYLDCDPPVPRGGFSLA